MTTRHGDDYGTWAPCVWRDGPRPGLVRPACMSWACVRAYCCGSACLPLWRIHRRTLWGLDVGLGLVRPSAFSCVTQGARGRCGTSVRPRAWHPWKGGRGPCCSRRSLKRVVGARGGALLFGLGLFGPGGRMLYQSTEFNEWLKLESDGSASPLCLESLESPSLSTFVRALWECFAQATGWPCGGRKVKSRQGPFIRSSPPSLARAKELACSRHSVMSALCEDAAIRLRNHDVRTTHIPFPKHLNTQSEPPFTHAPRFRGHAVESRSGGGAVHSSSKLPSQLL